ncbi:MAG: hypothetical protein ACKVHP_12695 [Verrucomicrobiales bacterium]
MKPTTTLAETPAPNGANFRLLEHDGEHFLYMDDRQIMSTKLVHSEEMLAELGCAFHDKRKNPRVLIGGLGLGYSLRRALEVTGPKSFCEVAELLPVIVGWNRDLLSGRNDDILSDARTTIFEGDVYDCIRQAADKGPKYDAILLDDGPSSLIQPKNAQLYKGHGLDVLKRALTPGGRAAFWTVESEPILLRNLQQAGFKCEEIPVARHVRAKRQAHRIYIAERP